MFMASDSTDVASLPVRGAWIEMPYCAISVLIKSASLPVRGAWIEILSSPPSIKNPFVAPRAGSVD